jgi:hypothetical protein
MNVMTRVTLQILLIAVVTAPYFLQITSTGAQSSDRELPIVISASVPFYPREANLAHIFGDVRIRVETDGLKVTSFKDESGPPMLVQAAKENIRSWIFGKHKPTTFVVTFRYRFDDDFTCTVGNSSAILHLPTEVQVDAKGVHSCDPTSEIRHEDK